MRPGAGFCRNRDNRCGSFRLVKKTPKFLAVSGVTHMPNPRTSTVGKWGSSWPKRSSTSPLVMRVEKEPGA